MRMKFFEKTYLLTLVLFLVFLNGCVLMLSLYSYENRVEATEQVCLSEQYTIEQAFEADWDGLGNASDLLLQTTYGNFYRKKGIGLCFSDPEGIIHYSSLPDGIAPADPGHMREQKSKDGVRHLLISQKICDGALVMTYSKDISEMHKEFEGLFITFLTVSVASSALLAVLLHLVLRRLYAPLVRLRSVTEQLSAGDFSVRAQEDGKDEFAMLGADFNRMADQIRAQMSELRLTADQKQQMLDNLAHEMRTPLMSIHGYAEYIGTANITDEERIDATQYIMSESMRLRSISETLLDMAFVRENRIECEPLSSRALLSRTLDHFAIRAQDAGVTLKSTDYNTVIWGNALLLELVLSNLTENAIKACPDGGHVEIGCRQGADSEVQLYVKDNGVGMTPEQLLHITEPFYRTDSSRSRRGGGTGLGLSLCDRVIKAHGGTLTFSSQVGQGSEAVVTLPQALSQKKENFTTP